jgi:DNA sulfur modification protein DndC
MKAAKFNFPASRTEDIGHDVAERLDNIRAELKAEYLEPHERPWIIGFSGGKDSTLVLQLVFEMLLELPPSRRARPVHVLSNDTRVESPVVQTFIDGALNRIAESVEPLRIPVTVRKTTPDLEGTFWVNLIGRGYAAPNRLFRWCTDRMKIRPTTEYIQKQVSSSGEVILLLGVRRLESSQRAKTVQRYDTGTRLTSHNSVKRCLVFWPIVDLSTDEVWCALLQRRPPWGGSHRDLMTLYRNAQGGECPFVVGQDDTPSCGTSSSRFGCWTCTVVEKDKSMLGFIDSGFEHLEPLVGFRDWLQTYSRDPSNRTTERRNGAPGLGPFTMGARKTILAELRRTQTEVRLTLITEAEVRRIKEIWNEDTANTLFRQADRIFSTLEET